jgi:hypothetical protein
MERAAAAPRGTQPYEIRNPKSEISTLRSHSLELSLGSIAAYASSPLRRGFEPVSISSFEFVSDFEFRISDLQPQAPIGIDELCYEQFDWGMTGDR